MLYHKVVIKILLPLIAVAFVAGFLIFRSVFLQRQPQVSLEAPNSQSSTLTQEPAVSTGTGTILPISSPTPNVTFPPSNVKTVDDSRIRTIETAIIDLRVQIQALRDASSQTTTTTTSGSSTKAPLYIPVGAGEAQMSGTDWITIPGYSVTIDTSNYSGYKSMQLEASMRLNQDGGSIQARLYNASDGSAITGSVVDVPASSYSVGSSAGFSLPSGSKTYQLQLSSTNGTQSFVQSARIKVNF